MADAGDEETGAGGKNMDEDADLLFGGSMTAAAVDSMMRRLLPIFWLANGTPDTILTRITRTKSLFHVSRWRAVSVGSG